MGRIEKCSPVDKDLYTRPDGMARLSFQTDTVKPNLSVGMGVLVHTDIRLERSQIRGVSIVIKRWMILSTLFLFLIDESKKDPLEEMRPNELLIYMLGKEKKSQAKQKKKSERCPRICEKACSVKLFLSSSVLRGFDCIL